MDPVAIITLIAQIIQTAVKVGPTVIQTVEDAEPFAQAIYNHLVGKEVTQADLDALEAQLKTLSDDFQTPLPPDDAPTA